MTRSTATHKKAIRKEAEAIRARYGGDGKNMARAIVVDIARENHLRDILDLWGGGLSARAFAECPGTLVTSAETEPDLWSALRQDAQDHHYTWHCGDARDVPGTFDLVWADLMGPAAKTTGQIIANLASKVRAGGWMAITLMGAREHDGLMAAARMPLVPLWLERLTAGDVRLVYPYQSAVPMMLYILHIHRRSDSRSHFASARGLENVEDDLSAEGLWSSWIPMSAGMITVLWPNG